MPARKTKLAILLLAAVCFLLSALFLASPAPRQVRAGNLAARSLSLGWLTGRPARACALLWSTKPVAVRWLCHSATTAHLITFTRLVPQTRYRALVISPLKPTFVKPLTTPQINQNKPALPEPAYGTVLDVDNRPAAGVLVYLLPVSGEFHAPLLALTNRQGGYAFDLANLSLQTDRFIIEAAASADNFVKDEFNALYHSPFPPLTLNRLDKAIND